MEHDVVGIAAVLAAVSAALFALAVVVAEPVERVARLGGLLPVHGLIGFLTGMIMIQLELADETVRALRSPRPLRWRGSSLRSCLPGAKAAACAGSPMSASRSSSASSTA